MGVNGAHLHAWFTQHPPIRAKVPAAMPAVLPILLRVLLSLTLVLNGVGYAAASTTMELHGLHADSEAGRTASASLDDTSMPCHTEADMIQMDMAHHGHGSCPASDMPPLANESGGSDCCDSGQCVCACAQHVVFALVMPAVPNAEVVHATSVRVLSLGHAQPALPHLIRPPIA